MKSILLKSIGIFLLGQTIVYSTRKVTDEKITKDFFTESEENVNNINLSLNSESQYESELESQSESESESESEYVARSESQSEKNNVLVKDKENKNILNKVKDILSDTNIKKNYRQNLLFFYK